MLFSFVNSLIYEHIESVYLVYHELFCRIELSFLYITLICKQKNVDLNFVYMTMTSNLCISLVT